MRIILLVLAVLILVPVGSQAVVDPDPDLIGVYFDEIADTSMLTVGASTPFDVYFIITNPSGSEVEAFEFRYWIGAPEGADSLVFRLSRWVPGNPSYLPCSDQVKPLECDVVAVLTTPIPASPAMVIFSMQLMILQPMYLHFYIEPDSFGVLAYQSEGVIIPLNVSSGDPTRPCAYLNDWVSSNTLSTFGTLKALYR